MERRTQICFLAEQTGSSLPLPKRTTRSLPSSKPWRACCSAGSSPQQARPLPPGLTGQPRGTSTDFWRRDTHKQGCGGALGTGGRTGCRADVPEASPPCVLGSYHCRVVSRDDAVTWDCPPCTRRSASGPQDTGCRSQYLVRAPPHLQTTALCMVETLRQELREATQSESRQTDTQAGQRAGVGAVPRAEAGSARS